MLLVQNLQPDLLHVHQGCLGPSCAGLESLACSRFLAPAYLPATIIAKITRYGVALHVRMHVTLMCLYNTSLGSRQRLLSEQRTTRPTPVTS